MSENERKSSPRPRSEPRSSSSRESAYGEFMLGDAASRLLDSLRTRLSELRKTTDPNASALAAECEKVLDEIRKELDALAAKRR